MLASATFPGSPAVQSHLLINHVCHVATPSEELHDLIASPCHLRPMRFRFRVLLQSTNLVPVEDEVHLPQTSFEVRRTVCKSVAKVVQITHAHCGNQAVNAEKVPASALKPPTQPFQCNQASEKREYRPK